MLSKILLLFLTGQNATTEYLIAYGADNLANFAGWERGVIGCALPGEHSEKKDVFSSLQGAVVEGDIG